MYLKHKSQKRRKVDLVCHHQTGFSLIELAMVLVLASLLFTAYLSWSSYKARESEATAVGNQVAQYIAAVDAYLASEKVQDGDKFTGTTWLLPTSCGGTSVTAYLPCGFTFDTSLMPAPPAVSVTNISAMSSRLSATIDFGVIGTTKDGVTLPNPGLAASVVNAARAYAGSSSAGTFIGVSGFEFDRIKASFKVNIVLQATKDTWLRVDGNNSMQNNITYNPDLADDQRKLLNVSAIQMYATSGNAVINSANSPLMLSAGGNNSLTMNNDGSILIDSKNQIGISSALELSINSKKEVKLGNQSGTKGDANVTVNDLKIHSMNDQKLTDLLGVKADSAIFNNNSQGSNMTDNCFSFTTGLTGHAMITAYIDVDFWFICNDKQSNYWILGILNINDRRNWLKATTQSYPFCYDSTKEKRHALAHTVVFYNFIGNPNTTYNNLCVSTYQTQPPVWQKGGWSYYAY